MGLLRPLAAVLFLTVAIPLASAGTDDALLAPAEAARGDRLIIDVRTPAEWRRTGIPAGAATADWHQPGGPDAFIREVLAKAGGRERPVAVICASGWRSAHARAALQAAGFTDVSDVPEGMMGGRHGPGWLARGLPRTPCPDC